MESQLDALSPYDNAIAVVGFTGRFPGAGSLDEFWANIRRGAECIRFFTPDELLAAGVPQSTLNQPAYVPARGCLEHIDLFDARFFGVNPREAEIMDPQQRMFVECAWEVLEHAGCNPDTFDGRVGVFAGARMSNYLHQNILPNFEELLREGFNLQILIGNDKDFLATRVSYLLNLKGPSLAVQTACSTSLVAVHVACRSLLMHECDMALAGGVALRLPHIGGYLYQQAGVVSPDGRCRAFDASAQGTVPGDGCGIVALKRYADAVANRDTIHALLLGSAVNNDGRDKVGFTAPGIEGQTEVVLEAQAVAGISPESISYIEAHGTGTALGDVVEMAALKKVFSGAGMERRSCAVGAVKATSDTWMRLPALPASLKRFLL
jgi:acyl transferase domain-containing protein